MKTRMILSCALLILLLFAIVVPARAQASSPQQTLDQYVADLQKNPDDTALREKIIRLVQEMKPAPTVPKEAERFMARGAAAVNSAKDANDFKDAVAEFEKATLAAPWLANAYYNLGVAQDKAGLYGEAMRSLKLYLLAAPNAPDANSVEKLVYEIEYRQEKAAKEAAKEAEEVKAKESSPEAVAARKQKEFAEWLGNLDGARYTMQDSNPWRAFTLTLDIKGTELVSGRTITWVSPSSDIPRHMVGRWEETGRYAIGGRELRGKWDNLFHCIYVISDDGNTITEKSLPMPDSGGTEEIDYVYRRER